MACVVKRARLGTEMELRSMGYVTVMFFAPPLYHSAAVFLTHIRFFFLFVSLSVSTFLVSFFCFSFPLWVFFLLVKSASLSRQLPDTADFLGSPILVVR